MRAYTSHADPALTETASPNPATLEAIGSRKRNLNCAQPRDGQNASPISPANPDSDVMSAASFEGSDSNSYYVELNENSPTRLDSTPYLAGQIRKMEVMYKVSEGDIDTIT